MGLSEFCIVEDGVISLRYIQPVCPICGMEKPFDERKFIKVYGMCQTCDESRNQILLWDEEEKP